MLVDQMRILRPKSA